MFYDLKLDDKSYRELKEEAVFHIPREYPEWTNYNSSDPGITLLQLFSWLTEVQQYHLSQPSEAKRRKYLELLGIEIQHICPSTGAVSVESGLGQIGNAFSILKGTRFFAENIPFETIEKRWVHPVKLIGAYMVQGDFFSSYHNIGNDFEKQMKLYPFGELPVVGNQCYFLLDRALSFTQKTDIYFDICIKYEITRNPADEQFIPLAQLKWEYYSIDGWEELKIEFDQTYAFLQSGKLRFHLQKEMAKVEEVHAYQIRVTLLENDFDVAPLIQNIYLNEIDMKQQYSVCDYEEYILDFSMEEENFSLCSDLYLAEIGKAELYLEKQKGWYLVKEIKREKTKEGDTRIWFQKPTWAKGFLTCRLVVFEKEMEEKRVIGIGNTFANQEFDLHISNILYNEFEIMVYDKENNNYMIYQKVESFDECTPEDMVYILDVEKRKLLFGNCERGMAPNGEIRMIRLKLSLGSDGNIKADKIRKCEAFPELIVKQYKETQNGQDEETISECFQRFRRELKEIHRGVTYCDYENLIKKAPGLLILDSYVIPPTEWKNMGNPIPENQISIVVQPFSFSGKHAVLSETYKKNLTRVLEKQKMLGTRIQLLNPEYIAISIYVEIVIKLQFLDAEKQMKKVVKKYLNEKTWEIGKPVLCSVLYGLLDTLPCVHQVKSLSISAQGNGFRYLVNGDVGLPPNGLAYLKDLEYCIYTAD